MAGAMHRKVLKNGEKRQFFKIKSALDFCQYFFKAL